ncbi:MAG: hypothetical protein JWM81_203 [Candidatus Saccharibacteria bacterium]|nr:hypothetical protein [Candidatus Saccharibacteria bacterium]
MGMTDKIMDKLNGRHTGSGYTMDDGVQHESMMAKMKHSFGRLRGRN